MVRRIIISMILTVMMVCLCVPVTVSADMYWPDEPETESASAIVMEVNSGTILYEKDSHRQRYPASITKIMTALLVIENCDLSETVTFSKDAVYKNEGDTSHISRDVGEQMTVEECLYAIMLASANECTYALAEHVAEKKGGDYDMFIDMMNEKAIELGCQDTEFHNCNGLPDEEHLTSAYDMALIASEAYKNDTFRVIAGTGKYTIEPTNKHSDPTYLTNHHGMLYPYKSRDYLYEYCTGGKTGYTTVADNTLVTYAEKNGMTLVCVVMKAKSPNQYLDTRRLMEYGFGNFSTFNIVENESSLTASSNSVGILNDNPSFVTLDKKSYIVLPKGMDFSKAVYELNTDSSQKDAVAEIRYIYGDRVVGNAKLMASAVQVQESIFSGGGGIVTVEEHGDRKRIIVHPVYLIIGIAGVVALVLIILLIRKLSDSFYIRRHSKMIRRMERERFQEIKPRKRRKRDSIFQ